MNQDKQTDALRLADIIGGNCAAELRTQHARIAELEAELAAQAVEPVGYPQLPPFEWGRLYRADQMRAYVDADRALRATPPAQAVEQICWWRPGSTDVLHNFSFNAVKSPHWQPLYALATQQAQDVQRKRWLEIGNAVERACKELPEGAEIQIYLERGAGTVHMTDWDGNEVDHFDEDHEDFACQINAAIDAAIAASAKGGE